MRPTQQFSVGSGTSSNRYSENTVNIGNAVAIEIAGSRKPATSSSNVEHPVQQTHLFLKKIVSGTPSTLKSWRKCHSRFRWGPISFVELDVQHMKTAHNKTVKGTPSSCARFDDIRIPWKSVKKGSALATDVLHSPKPAASPSNVFNGVFKQLVLLKITFNQTPSSLTQSGAITIPRKPRNIFRTADAAATDVSASRKPSTSSGRALATDVPTSEKRPALCPNFGSPVPKKKALLSTQLTKTILSARRYLKELPLPLSKAGSQQSHLCSQIHGWHQFEPLHNKF